MVRWSRNRCRNKYSIADPTRFGSFPSMQPFSGPRKYGGRVFEIRAIAVPRSLTWIFSPFSCTTMVTWKMQSIAQRAFFFSIHFFSSLICCGTEVNTSYGGHLSNFPIAFEDGSQRSIRFSVFISVEYRYVGFIAIFSGFASISRHSARILFTLPKLLHCANTICEGRDYMFLL